MLHTHLFRPVSLTLAFVACMLVNTTRAQTSDKAVPPNVRTVSQAWQQTTQTPTPPAAGPSPALPAPSPVDKYNDATLRYRNLIDLVTQITHAHPEDLEQRLQALEAQLKAAAAVSQSVVQSAAPTPPAPAIPPHVTGTLPTDLFAAPETSDSPSAEPHVSQLQGLSGPESLRLLAENYERLAQQLEALAADLNAYARSNRDIARQLRTPHR
jgi:hypothetical protein